MSKANVYEIVTEKIVAQLEAGTVPWRKPWRTTAPMSMSSRKPYRGINVFLLMGDGSEGSNWWGTYKQIEKMGGQVRQGEKSSLATFWKMLDGEDDNGNPKKVPLLRYFRVFSANQVDWTDGMPEAFRLSTGANDPIADAEAVVDNWKATGEAPAFSANPSDRACYFPKLDMIEMPHRDAFESSELFYSTLFHEMTHSTGHASRLARPGVVDFDGFGSHTYGDEELVAEMGAAMLCGHVGIETTFGSSAAYIASWLNAIGEDPKLLVGAAGRAQKAADLILGVTFD